MIIRLTLYIRSSGLLFYPGFVDGLDMGNNTKVSSCFDMVLSNSLESELQMAKFNAGSDNAHWVARNACFFQAHLSIRERCYFL